ncbi:E3 ubiquitin-protein ligase TRIM33 isoform X2 [Melanotaenia boesemani]|uniref:E3 ubiquitin-protein ligase TRIM33 isoform X2 n=1 Tax=Melanotaenia boesemani TaxID=1250792 RepID=UPI001C042122|nr:E3 ubiquitin-protein ligase TRIM33 isoform X2 [Melanotaenia boesemani]
MADNKGEEDMEPSANSDSVLSAQENEQSDPKTDNAAIVMETNSKEDAETEPLSNANEATTPNSEGGDVSSGGTVVAAGEANGSVSNAVSPAESSSTNAEPAGTETVPAVDAPVGGPATEMSPPPTTSAATPVSTTINLLDTCAVCKQSLQSRDCEPKLLPCLHTFCLKCIPQPDRQISVQVPGPHGQTDTHIVNVMRCAVCHQDYKQSDIIDNYFVKDTTEATSTSDEKAAQVCTSCEDNAGTIGFCVECGEWLCKTCVEAHQRVKITKDHKIRTKEDTETASESVTTAGQRPVFCPIHKQEPLKLFCETCDTLTCRDCQLLEHKEHRYQFLEEAFQNHKGFIETNMAKLQEKKNYVHYSVSQVQNRLKELNETHRKVEHEIKIAVFTLINEINKKGKSLLQQLESVTKERSMRLVAQHKDTTQLAQQINHVLNFCQWAITSGSSTALLYSKRPIMFQFRQLFKARLEPAPQSNGVVRFFCDPTFWAKNVVNLGNLVIEKPPPPPQPPNVMVGGPAMSPGQGHPGKHPGQINLAQLRLQHMQQAYAQQKQQQQQQMRIASQMSQQHARHSGPTMVQQQPPRLISMQQLQRVPGGVNGGPGPSMYSSHHMRIPGPPPQGRMPSAQPRHNGQQYSPMMQPQLQRQMSIESEMSHQRFRFLLQSGHSNPGHAGPFPVASLHNANPTSPTSASMAGAHAHRGPASPVIGPIELIPSVTNPENLPCLPEIPPIQLEDAGSSNLGHLLSRYITASAQHPLGSLDMNPSPGLSTLSPGSSGLSNAHTPARPSSASSTGSRGSCSSAGRAGTGAGSTTEQVRVKKEPGTEDSYTCPTSLKTEHSKDAGRSACMMSSPESSPQGVVSTAHDAHKVLGERIKTEPESETPCSALNGASATTSSSSSTMTSTTSSSTFNSSGLTNGNLDKGTENTGGGEAEATRSLGGKEDDPNEDWCAVCINGGDLLCCDRCPKVFHMKCHVPTIKIFPKGDFLCTFCRSLTDPEIEYCDESKKIRGEDILNAEDQRRCERLLLYIFCHELSMGFREPVPSSVPNYYKIIKQPMDLKRVKKKLQLRSSQFYKSIQDFVSDIRLIFKNCAKYNEVGSEMAISGKAVGLYFEEKLEEMFPGQIFPDTPEPESPEEKERENDTDDSEDDFIQPRRKRLKTDEKVLHIK